MNNENKENKSTLTFEQVGEFINSQEFANMLAQYEIKDEHSLASLTNKLIGIAMDYADIFRNSGTSSLEEMKEILNGVIRKDTKKEEYDLSGLILERISHWENDKQIFHDEYYILDYQGDSENLILPSSAPNGMPILHIGTWAFADCHTLKTVTIPQGIQTIEKRAFYGCENLEKVIIGKDINTISDFEVFSLCNKLSVFEVDKDNT